MKRFVIKDAVLVTQMLVSDEAVLQEVNSSSQMIQMTENIPTIPSSRK